ncbi:MAG: hypothetical protein ABIX44_10310, partial [Cryobacterium sp.]
GVQDTLDAYKRLGEGTPTALGRSIVKAYVSIHDSIQNNTVPNPADISGPGSPTDLCGKLGVHVVQG